MHDHKVLAYHLGALIGQLNTVLLSEEELKFFNDNGVSTIDLYNLECACRIVAHPIFTGARNERSSAISTLKPSEPMGTDSKTV